MGKWRKYAEVIPTGSSEAYLESIVSRAKAYRPGMYSRSDVLGLLSRKDREDEKLIEYVEEEGNEEEAVEKLVRRLLQHPGTKKEEAKRWAMRRLSKLKEEGRI